MTYGKMDILKRVKNRELAVEHAVELLTRGPRSGGEAGRCLYFIPIWEQIKCEEATRLAGDDSLLLFDLNEERFRILREGREKANIVLVKPATGFKEEKGGVFYVNPNSPEDYARLLDILRKREILPSRVLHCWMLGRTSVFGSSKAPGAWDHTKIQFNLEQGLNSIFLLTQAFLRARHDQHNDIVFAYSEEKIKPSCAAVDAFGRVASLESSRIRIRVARLTDTTDPAWTVEHLLDEFGRMEELPGEIRIDRGGRWRRTLKELSPVASSDATQELRIQPDGIYLITGAFGGLGRIFARHLAGQARVRFVFVGRSPLDAPKKEFIHELEQLGSEVTYYAADIARSDEIIRVIECMRRLGPIRGVIHAAGLVADSRIVKKDLAGFERVLAAKVFGTMILDEATQEEPLDFFVAFSSIGSILPNPGQADYAAANRFLDDFIAERADRVKMGKRSGRSLAINWPFWAEGGMKMSVEVSEKLRQEAGLLAMPTVTGLTAFKDAFRSGYPQVIVVYGEPEKLRPLMTGCGLPPLRQPVSNVSGTKVSLGEVENYLLDLVAEKAKFPREDINPLTDLEMIGLDSILVNKINAFLEEDLGHLPKTLFYEHPNIRALAAYLKANHGEALSRRLHRSVTEKNPLQSVVSSIDLIPDQSVASALDLPVDSREFTVSGNGDIAIIGVHGRYPEAENLAAFWKNLKDGKDSIVEIPSQRWDHARFFHPNRKQKGTSYGKWGGFLDDFDQFDALFFNISPREAETMDPQERLFLETAWSALEDAGYARYTLMSHDTSNSQRRTGVFVGVTYGHYQTFSAEAWAHGRFIPAYSSFWSIANRVSYTLNLRGPSLAVDTACSSSLTAVHLACESLYRGECDTALAGGVNLNIHPLKYIALSDMQFLSSDGRCRAFGAGGDGYVPGEGVGVMVLKPLTHALEDGDHIYAVIKGSAINHGGKTNGYTVPSPQAQADVINSALKRAGVPASTISYIEAHGTGTSLGDPIEIAGLTKVFDSKTESQQYCAIGSLKSNIGHLEAAAGIAALTKVVLQMRHKMLVPSLHAEELNSNIEFTDTPFYVCRKLEEWSPMFLRENGMPTYPRRAAISSFGAGGANAHIILEEFETMVESSANSGVSKEVIVVSARDQGQLQILVKMIREHILADSPNLRDLAYTLGAGREAFEARLGFVVHDQRELIEKLDIFLEGKANFPGLHFGELKSGRIEPDEEEMRSLFREDRLDELIALWVKGADIPWERRFAPGEGRRISIPTYPFRRQRYWLPDGYTTSRPWITENPALHPLIHRVIPSLRGAEFARVILPGEPLVAEHQVLGAAVLPGVAHLEMARIAGEYTAGRQVTTFEDVTWITPVSVPDNGLEVRILLKEAGDGILRYELEADGRVCSRGRLRLMRQNSADVVDAIDLEAIKARCPKWVTGDEVYEEYKKRGLSYGSYFRRLAMLWFNEEEAVGQVFLNGLDDPLVKQYGLHPGLFDGALHALHAFLPHGTDEQQTMLPFAVSRIEIYGMINGPCYAYARRVRGNTNEATACFNVDILDEMGKPLLSFQSFFTRSAHMSVIKNTLHENMEEAVNQMFFYPTWRETHYPPVGEVKHKQVLICGHANDLGLGQNLLQHFGSQNNLMIDLECGYKVEEWEEIISKLPDLTTIYFLGGVFGKNYSLTDLVFLDEAQEIGPVALFRLLKALGKRGAEAVQLYAFTNDLHPVTEADRPFNAFAGAIDGLARTAAHEFRRLKAMCIDVTKLDMDSLTNSETRGRWLAQVTEERLQSGEFGVAWRGERRFALHLEQDKHHENGGEILLRNGGVYLLVGGAGGLGIEIGRYLARTYRARLVLIGRSELTTEQLSVIAGLEKDGGKALYLRADVTDEVAMRRVVDQVRREFGAIHGVIHTAIVLRDGAIQTLTEKDFLAALAPKVRGTVVLNRVLEAEPLDFMVFFSSSISFTAAPGQSNYTTGCAFKDAFAQALRLLKGRSVRVINWGFWGDVGIVATPEYRERLARIGVIPITTAEGVQAFSRIMAGKEEQVLAIKLHPDQIHGLILNQKSGSPDDKRIIEVVKKAEQFRSEVARTGSDLGDAALLRLEALGRERLLVAFQRMGVFQRAKERYHVSQLKDSMGIVSAHHRLWTALPGILERAGFLRLRGEEIETTSVVSELSWKERLSSIERQEITLAREVPDSGAYLTLISRCLEAYPRVLTGEIPAVEVIFPGGSTTLVDGIYRGNRRVDYFNRLLAKGINAMVKSKTQGENEKFTLIEVGSGTGGTSSFVLEELSLNEDCICYDYTDISPQLVRIGEQRFGATYPFARFKALNIEKDVSMQGFNIGGYDVVLATNVLHATRNIKETLTQIKKLLKTDGLIVINELTRNWNFATLTFGLTSGWWLFEDREVRLADSPLLAISEWRRLLEETGFYEVHAIGAPGVPQEMMDQSVIFAMSSGCTGEVRVTPATASVLTKTVNTSPAVSLSPVLGTGHASVAYLSEMIARVLKMNFNDLETDVSFDRYGVDSLVAMDIISQLEKDFGSLRKDLLFEHTTIEALSRYLATLNSTCEESIDSLPKVKSTPLSHAEESVRLSIPNHIFGNKAVIDSEIAVVGVSGRFPGAPDVESFWELLKMKKIAIKEIPRDRWEHSAYYDPSGQAPGTSYGKWGGFLEDIDRFDPLFFGISPREAEVMDPQERLFLETVWLTLEDAGYTRIALNRYAENNDDPGVGVFVGVMHGTYQLLAAEEWGRENRIEAYSSYWSIANRVSYVLDFHGPSMALDSACSSSLTAVHMACESIRRGECRAAIAGGVNLILHPSHIVGLSKMKMLSKDSQSRSFGAGADGLVPGEGVGAVLLKPLAEAIKDGDFIYGVIRGSTVNSDGKGQGYAVPNVDAQARLITNAFRRAGIDPETVGYIEAQAVGSALGDKIEVAALSRVFGEREGGQTRAIGTLKPNVGHLEAASGIAQLIKVLLQLKRGMLLPTILPDRFNPEIDLAGASFRLQSELSPWERNLAAEMGINGETPRRAGISSFGAGGSNAHLIVEEPPEVLDEPEPDERYHLIVLSARKPDQLRTYAGRLRDFLVRQHESMLNTSLNLANLAYTLQIGREPMDYRLAVVSRSLGDLVLTMDRFLAGEEPQLLIQGRVLRENRGSGYLNPDEVRSCLDAGDYQGIARAWVEGREIEWEKIYTERLPRRIPLPGYPFQGERYWVEREKKKETIVIPPDASCESKESERIPAQPLIEVETVMVGGQEVVSQNNSSQQLSHEIRDVLLKIMTEILYLSQNEIDIEENLGDYGFNSITLTEFARRIGEQFDIDLNPTIFFEHSTIQSVAEHLRNKYWNAVAASLGSMDKFTGRPEHFVKPATTMDKITTTAITEDSTSYRHGIAVVGMTGIFPGAPNLDVFWENLSAMVSMARQSPAGRFDQEEAGGDNNNDSIWGCFLDRVNNFDASFFNISPREARLMDPQQRLFLQAVWTAIEDAGYAPGQLSGTRTGVFVGVAGREYAHIAERIRAEIDGHTVAGNTLSILANRVSYLLNLRGPSEPIDTACSSSLVAIHRAITSIRVGECEQAIVGGVNLLLTPTGFHAFQKTGMLSNDGRCKTFDDRADGYVRGEGLGVVILKPLIQAINNGDHIYGVIRGSAINHGGRANSLTAPNAVAQAEVIAEAIQRAGVSPETITYVEAHGTGTALGDPVEINGLKNAFARFAPSNCSERSNWCGLGTVKTNIGHLETAAGIAGLIKVLLAMKHRILPGLVNFRDLNQYIELIESPFYLVTGTRPWNRMRDGQGNEIPLRAGVSSFGFGGVNSHIVVEQFESPRKPLEARDRDQVIILSARNEERLRCYAMRLADWLKQDQDSPEGGASLADIAYTFQVGRDEMDARLAIVVKSKNELTGHLSSFLKGHPDEKAFFQGNAAAHREVVTSLNDDPEHRVYLAGLVQKEQARRIALLWTKGFDVDWQLLHGNEQRLRVPLPTYPFAEDGFWVMAATPKPAVSDVPINLRIQNEPSSDGPLKSLASPSTRVMTDAAHISSKENLQEEIRYIFADFLGYEAAEIADDDLFSAYGVDSIAGLRIMQLIQSYFGDDIPMLSIIRHPTVALFTSYIWENHLSNRLRPMTESLTSGAKKQPETVTKEIMPESADFPEVAVAATLQEPLREKIAMEPEVTVQKESSKAILSGNLLIPLQPHGDGEPLFGVCGNIGEVSWLTPLASHRGPEQPTFGLETVGFDGQNVPHLSVEAMAALYADEIKKLGHQGSISLAGYGTGGTITVEVARQLEERGRKVARLYLIDPYFPGAEITKYLIERADSDPAWVLTFIANLAVNIWNGDKVIRYDEVAGWQPDKFIRRLKDLLASHAPKSLQGKKLGQWLKRCVNGFRTMFEALRDYQPSVYSGAAEVYIIQCQPDYLVKLNPFALPFGVEIPVDPGLNPKAFISSSRLHEVPYGHFEVLRSGIITQVYQRVSMFKGRKRSLAAAPVILRPGENEDVYKQFLVPINKNGAEPPSFWVHTLLGDVSYVLNLSNNLGIEYPVYGLEQFSVSGKIYLLPTIEEMAEAYIQSIKRVRPKGPYRIGGYSFGGIVAFEMARQLIEAGEEPPEIILIDALLPGTEVFNAIDTKAFGETEFSIMALFLIANFFGFRWGANRFIQIDEVTGLDLELQIQRIARHLYQNSKTPLDFGELLKLVRSYYEMIITNNDTLVKYMPKRIEAPAKMLLFHATLGFVGPNNPNGLPNVKILVDDRSNGFGPFVTGRFDIYEVPADHYTICNDEFIKVVAEETKRWLGRQGRRS